LPSSKNREGLILVEVVEALDLALLKRDELRGPPGLLHGPPGVRQLHLLHAVGGQERDLLALQ
jgi:hypothetical protein